MSADDNKTESGQQQQDLTPEERNQALADYYAEVPPTKEELKA